MKKCVWLLLIASLVSCNNGDDDVSDFYPNILTEFAMIRTDDAGTMIELTTDNEQTYTIANPQEGYDKNANYRAVCGYVADGHMATLYHAPGPSLSASSSSSTDA